MHRAGDAQEIRLRTNRDSGTELESSRTKKRLIQFLEMEMFGFNQNQVSAMVLPYTMICFCNVSDKKIACAPVDGP